MRELHAAFDLLDRQVLDSEDRELGKVDDLEISRHAGSAHVVALLLGPQALAARVGGRLGAWMDGIGRMLANASDPIRVPVELIEDLGVAVKLKVPAEELPRVGHPEEWLRRRFVGKIPGSEHGSE